MMILLTYDIDITTRQGERRLRDISKACERYGERVQKSVYEMLIDPHQLDALKRTLLSLMDPKTDSIRLYRLGKNYQPKIEVLGETQPLPQDGLMAV